MQVISGRFVRRWMVRMIKSVAAPYVAPYKRDRGMFKASETTGIGAYARYDATNRFPCNIREAIPPPCPRNGHQGAFNARFQTRRGDNNNNEPSVSRVSPKRPESGLLMAQSACSDDSMCGPDGGGGGASEIFFWPSEPSEQRAGGALRTTRTKPARWLVFRRTRDAK